MCGSFRILALFVPLLVDWGKFSFAYELRPQSIEASRRRFFANTASTAVCIAANAGLAAAVDIKVSPLAHTFVTANGAPKPVRENDATRFFTNAKVVYLLEGKDANRKLAGDILDLTVKRKAVEGPGVTPGKVRVLSGEKRLTDMASGLGLDVTSKSISVDSVVATAKAMPEGDVLLVGPIPSAGVATDGKILADTATGLNSFVGLKTGRGVVSVLLDGPRQNLKTEDGEYQVSDILWYSV